MSRRTKGKTVDDLTEDDFRKHPVWQFTNDDNPDTWMVPVEPLPTEHLTQRIAATHITLANGDKLFATISNVDTRNPKTTKHFLSLTVWTGGRPFHLARYHDIDVERRGPESLARSLKLPLDAVFPIRYDLSEITAGDRRAIAGTIEATPPKRLSRRELITMAVREG